jgi:hypothetical protein
VAKKPDGKKIKCSGECGRELVINNNFYQSKSPFFPEGYVTICKKCIADMVDYSDMNTIYTVMQTLDIPFFYNRWEETCKKSPKNSLGNYIRMANSGLNEFSGARYKDSVFNNSTNTGSEVKDDDFKPNFSIPDMTMEQLCEKWGYNYSKEELFLFEQKYRKLIDSYGEKTALHTENLLTYIRFRVKEEMATAQGDAVSAQKWGGLAENASKNAKITVQQLSKSDISGGVDLMPQLFEAVEDKIGIIPTLPYLKEQPYDDADLIIWAIINYLQRLEDKSRIEYRDIWNFYDDMLGDFYKQKGFNDVQIQEERNKRNAVFRDLSKVYKEPIYEDGEE